MIDENWNPPRDYGWIYPLALFVALIAWLAGVLA